MQHFACFHHSHRCRYLGEFVKVPSALGSALTDVYVQEALRLTRTYSDIWLAAQMVSLDGEAPY
jgi:hypothetical protein